MKSYALLMLLVFVFFGFGSNGIGLGAENAGDEGGLGSSFSLFSLVRPLGIATLSCVCATFVTGLLRRKLGRRFLRLHLPLAVISVSLGLAHGIVVLIVYNL